MSKEDEFIQKHLALIKEKTKMIKEETGEYFPYGKEWQKEMMKFPKPALIMMLAGEFQKVKQYEKEAKIKLAGSQWASSAHPTAVNGDETFLSAFMGMNKSIKCLALELPESVWNDVNDNWRKFTESLPKAAAPKAVKSKEIESAETILGCWALTGPEPYDMPVTMEKDSILQAMEEYADIKVELYKKSLNG